MVYVNGSNLKVLRVLAIAEVKSLKTIFVDLPARGAVLAGALFMAGCAATSTQEIAQSASSGKLGCAPAEVEIVQHEPITIAASRSWVAKCKGATYRCSGVSTGNFAYSDVSCSQVHGNNVRSAGSTAAPLLPSSANASGVGDTDSTKGEPATALSVAPKRVSKTDARQRSVTTIEVQKHLQALGYKVGIADGTMGKRTIDALKKFQSDNQLPVTGAADEATVSKLAEKRTAARL